MSIFITLLAFKEAELVINTKIAILIALVMAGTIGFIWLGLTFKTICSKQRRTVIVA